MSVHCYSAAEVRINALRERSVAVIGYGNQGRAQALNLRDSGLGLKIGQRPGRSFDQAVADGFAPMTVADVVRQADLIILTLPDETAADVFNGEIMPNLAAGQALGFSHGFNIRFGFITPPESVDVIMVAPKGPGALLRSLYVEGKGLPALVAVERDVSGHAEAIALAWAAGIGAGRARVVRTTFAAEAETDLFGEQTVLCGGVTALCRAAFETLVQAGYEPEFAYLECVHELKQIVDLIYAHGIEGMRERISNTAEYGDRTRGARVVGLVARQAMKRILDDIQSGRFAQEWMVSYRQRGEDFRKEPADAGREAFERAGAAVRKWMPWLDPS